MKAFNFTTEGKKTKLCENLVMWLQHENEAYDQVTTNDKEFWQRVTRINKK